jgi:hypothetical protein
MRIACTTCPRFTDISSGWLALNVCVTRSFGIALAGLFFATVGVVAVLVRKPPSFDGRRSFGGLRGLKGVVAWLDKPMKLPALSRTLLPVSRTGFDARDDVVVTFLPLPLFARVLAELLVLIELRLVDGPGRSQATWPLAV